MDDETIVTEDSQTQQRRTETALIRSASTGSLLYLTVIGSIPAMFLLKGLGASPFHIGLLTTLCSITAVGMLLGTVLVHRVGKVRLMVLGRLAGLVPAAAMIVLAALGQRGEIIIYLAILSTCILALVMNIGTTSWWPLLQDNVPQASMGTFFAKMRTRLRSVEIGLPLLMGFWLGDEPSMRKFALPFGLAVAGMIVGAYVLRGLPERHSTAPDVGLPLRLRLAGRDRHVRSCMLFFATFFMIAGLFGPFWMVLLTHTNENPFLPGLPAGFVVWLGAISATGHMLSLKLWAYTVDHHGGRSASGLCLIGSAVLGLAWLLLPGGETWLYVWAVAFYFVWGTLEGGAMMGRTWSMLRSVPLVYQSDSFVLVQIATAAGGSVGALIGGIIFEVLTRATSAGWRPGGMDPRAVYLCLAQLALIVAYFASRRLIGYERQTPTSELLRQAWERIVE